MLKRTLISATVILVILGAAVALAQEDGDAVRGAVLYAENCLSCHGPRGEARASHPAFASDAQYDVDFVEVVLNGVAGTYMGPWGIENEGLLSERDAADLRAFVQSWHEGEAVALPEPDIPASAIENSVADGAALYLTNCAACHGADGQGRGSKRFPAIALDTALLTITRRGNDAAGMPPFSAALGGPLTDVEIGRIADYVRTWQRPSELQVLAAESPQGAALLVLLMGLGAVAAIGGIVMLGRGEG